MTRFFAFLLLVFGIAFPVAHAAEPDYDALPLAELTQMAEAGNAAAQTNLGFRHAAGEGLPQDFQEAIKWFRKAAAKGQVKAEFSLGSIYDSGEGVERDLKEAAKWYRKAATRGFLPALFNLGLMYENGEGVAQDIVLAYALFSLAAADGNRDAVTARDIVGARMNPAQIKEGKTMAEKWQPGKTIPTTSKTGVLRTAIEEPTQR